MPKRKIQLPHTSGMKAIRRDLAEGYQRSLSILRQKLKTGGMKKEEYLKTVRLLRQLARQAKKDYPKG